MKDRTWQNQKIIQLVIFGVGVVCMLGSPSVLAEEKKKVIVASGEIEFSESLIQRENELIAREKALEKQQAEYEILKKEVDEKLIRLTDLQDRIRRKLDELVVVKDKEFKNLVKVYSTMSVSKVAPLLNKMDDETVVKILRSMKADIVAKIMPKFDQEKAVRVSKQLGLID